MNSFSKSTYAPRKQKPEATTKTVGLSHQSASTKCVLPCQVAFNHLGHRPGHAGVDVVYHLSAGSHGDPYIHRTSPSSMNLGSICIMLVGEIIMCWQSGCSKEMTNGSTDRNLALMVHL
jgi:hypothetical protein